MQQSTINARLIQVASGKRTHPHYGLVCENAELYTALSTGVGISAYMKRYSRRESAEVYKVRCEITEQITPSIIDSLSAILEKGYRSFYRRELNYGDGEDSEAKTMAMEEMLRGYAGGMGVDGFCQARLIELQSTDPNTWIVQEWKDFDNVVEHASPYPFEASAHDAIDFDYDRGELQYLTVLTYLPNPKDADNPLKKYTCYQKNMAATLVQTPDNVGSRSTDTELAPGIVNIDGRRWIYTEYAHGLGFVNAKRVGYRRDKKTKGQTFVWPFEPAQPWLMKTLKVVSELDLTAANVAMPLTVRFGDVCNAPKCNGGLIDNGTTCSTCHGTGKKKTPTSVLEEIVITPMPESAADMIDLSKVYHYIAPPVEILDWQKAYTEWLENKCLTACLHSETYTKTEIAETATGKNLDQDNANDFVYKYFRFYAEFWLFTVNSFATITGKDAGLKAQIVVNRDMKLKTMGQLFQEMKEANESGVGPAARQAIEWDIMRVATIDNPAEFVEYQVRERFNPFSGYTEEQKMAWAQSPLVPIQQRILYANLGYVFDQLEFEVDNFYKLPYAQQKELVAAKVQELVEQTGNTAPELNVNI